jgi:hypothetical protein
LSFFNKVTIVLKNGFFWDVTPCGSYAVAPGRIPAKDFLCVEKAIVTLLEETAEEIRQETVRTLKGSLQPKDNLTGAERRALRPLKANDSLNVLPADKSNAAAVLGTSDYNKKIATLLQDKAYATLRKDPTESIRAQDCSPEKVLIPTGGLPPSTTTGLQAT